jgi:hypothetical protein
MPGTWTVTGSSSSPVHTFTAPEDGWLVTSHIIELPSQLLVVDAQYTLPYAHEVTLEKGVFFASLRIVGRLADALGVEPAELLRLPQKAARRK